MAFVFKTNQKEHVKNYWGKTGNTL